MMRIELPYRLLALIMYSSNIRPRLKSYVCDYSATAVYYTIHYKKGRIRAPKHRSAFSCRMGGRWPLASPVFVKPAAKTATSRTVEVNSDTRISASIVVNWTIECYSFGQNHKGIPVPHSNSRIYSSFKLLCSAFD